MSRDTQLRMRSLWIMFALLEALCVLQAGCSGGEPNRQWSSPGELSSGSLSYSPVLVADNDGRTLAVWRGPNPDPNPVPPAGPNALFASWKPLGGGWETSIVLDDFRSVPVRPSVAAGPTGDAVVVWAQVGDDNEPDEVWVRRYEIGTSWGPPERIGIGARSGQSPRVAIGPAGRAFVGWLRRTADGEEIALSEWSGGQWVPRESFSIGAGWFLDFGIDASGRVTVVWWTGAVEGAGGTWVNRFTTEVGWESAAELVDEQLLGRPSSVDLDAQGTVWALWAGERQAGIDTCEVVARNTPNGWDVPTRFDAGCFGGAGGAIAGDGVGGAVAVWNQWYDSLAGTVSRAFWSRYRDGEGWSAPEEAPLGVGAGPALWSLNAGADGGSLALWYRAGEGDNLINGNGQFAVWAGWLDADGLWNDPERLTELGPWTTPANPILAPPAVLRHSDGRAVGAWLGYSGSREDLSITVWSAEFR